MNLAAVSFSRVVMHHIVVKQRGEEHASVDYEDALIQMNEDVETTLKSRLIEAAGKSSKIFELEFADIGQGSYYQLVSDIHSANDANFMAASKRVADKLAFHQTRTNIPGGYLLFLEGRHGEEQKKIVITIKAEPHDALKFETVNGVNMLQLLKDIFLSPSQKFYKLGIIYEREEPLEGDNVIPPNDLMGCLLFDEQFRVDGTPAEYFYQDFLGFSTKHNAKIQTFGFYDQTNKFIQDEIDDEEFKQKAFSYLKNELRNAATEIIQPMEFARRHFTEQQLVDRYAVTVADGLPGSIFKDTTLIERKILNKKIDFSSRINIAGPDEGFDENVELIRSEEDFTQLDPNDSSYTIVKISGRPFA